ncbi:MAG: hypothetical protein AAFU49_14320 [Pseudomonadota bacterium]
MPDENRTEKEERRLHLLFIFGFVGGVTALASYAVHRGATPGDIALIGFTAFGAIIIAFAAAVLWQIVEGRIDLYGIVSEPQGEADIDGRPKASLSRFQFLIFTFVVAGLFLMLSIEAGAFVKIPENVLILIGLSGGSFIVSKAVGHGDKTGKPKKDGKGARSDAPVEPS